MGVTTRACNLVNLYVLHDSTMMLLGAVSTKIDVIAAILRMICMRWKLCWCCAMAASRPVGAIAGSSATRPIYTEGPEAQALCGDLHARLE